MHTVSSSVHIKPSYRLTIVVDKGRGAVPVPATSLPQQPKSLIELFSLKQNQYQTDIRIGYVTNVPCSVA